MFILNIKGCFLSLPMLKQIAGRTPKGVFGVKMGDDRTYRPIDLKGIYPPRKHVQYDARDKFQSGVVGGRTTSESVATGTSIAGESGAKAKRIARETSAIVASPRPGRCH